MKSVSVDGSQIGNRTEASKCNSETSYMSLLAPYYNNSQLNCKTAVTGDIQHTEGSDSDLLYCAFYLDYIPGGTTTTGGRSEPTYCSCDLNRVPPKHGTERRQCTTPQTTRKTST
jgi:hypothetical protein